MTARASGYWAPKTKNTIMTKLTALNPTPQKNTHSTSEVAILKQQLTREIACLERQLERVRSRQEFAEYTTIQTYEEMIESRRNMLDNLPWVDY